ncbi:MAG: cysteine--tRNA ligase [Candidatus Saccharibacteria bacterium]|nr:cysteine--tRNA ligase [Candidatus Saccharibacteria bacterium]
MKLYDTRTKQVSPIKPLHDKKIAMYTCGLTVYSQPQIGNWVAYIYADVLHRILLDNGYQVTRVQNITDVGHLVSDDDTGEDKMEKGAKKEGKSAWDIADKYIAIADTEAYDWLGLLRPTKLIRATDLIGEQIEFTKRLEAGGYTYIIENEGVYFDTSKFPDYTELASLDIKGQKAGFRVDVKGKKNPTDFAVWKFSPHDRQRDMEWDSPWGKGFPGWHLECSVIAYESLGEQIDIHTGGVDHIPVHHTNEIAQTEAITKKRFVQHWFHNNHIKINGAKLSKSLGNSYTLQDIIDHGYSLDAFKLLVLSSHYSTEGNFSWEILESFQNNLNDWTAFADLQFQGLTSEKLAKNYKLATDKVKECLSNNLDTPEALGYINGIVNRVGDLGIDSKAIATVCKEIDKLLGLHLSKRKDITKDQKTVIINRQKAKDTNDWAQADELRDQLKEQGIQLRDTPQGTVWAMASA